MRALVPGRHVGVALQRVGEAGVLGDGPVPQVQFLGMGVGQVPAVERRHILYQRALHRQCRGYDRLGLLVEIDQLGVATGLVVGDPGVGPDVLVVADEVTVGVGRQGRLARARQPEQDGAVAAGADVGRAVHRELALARLHEVHDREHGLLVDAAVVGPAQRQGQSTLHVDDHRPRRESAVTVGAAAERRNVQKRPSVLAMTLGTVEAGWQHDIAVVGVGGVLAHEPARLGEVGVGAAVHVGHVEPGPPLVQVGHDPVHQRVERGCVEPSEAVLPPHVVADRGTVDAEGVVHRTPRAGRIRVEDEGAVGSQGGGVGLVVVVGPPGTHPTPVAADRGREQLVLGKAVADVDTRQSQGRCELGRGIDLRRHVDRRHRIDDRCRIDRWGYRGRCHRRSDSLVIRARRDGSVARTAHLVRL